MSVRCAWLCAIVLLTGPRAWAQLSPGDLSRFHESLEGARNCRHCHEAGKGVTPALCLVCHTALGQRIAAGKGLHARSEYRACERCHVEHQGRGFDLVFWGKQGRAAFDHTQTGLALQGRHARLGCESCHHPRRIRDPAALARGGVNLGRTFLGLAAACASCHADPHRGQFAPRGCTDCHGQDHWKPPVRFDHTRTDFPLTGRHQAVACARCHPAAPGGGERFKGVAHQTCASCHKDPHAGRLGAQCATCHTTEGWGRLEKASFDHDRTRFPLRGRHARVVCAACHPPGRPRSLAHARCTDCHVDRHAGQLARRPDGGRCESCHDLEGFQPARFTVDDHACATYPLTGAHLAVPCDACHREVPLERLRALGFARGDRLPDRTEQLRFATTRCSECHADPHRGQTARVGACDGCHRTDAWTAVTFDHARTAFPLEEGHAHVACRGCHPGADGALAFAGRPRACASCHKDPHGGQFARSGRTDCARCHTAASWARFRFDHDRETSFPLVGAHRAIPCVGCHLRHTPEGQVMRYSGLGTSCTDCHGAPGAPPRRR